MSSSTKAVSDRSPLHSLPSARQAVESILNERPGPVSDPNGYERRSYDSFFSHGYLLSTSAVERPTIGQWREMRIGDFQGWVEWHTRVVSASVDERRAVVLFGHPVDIYSETTDAERIAQSAARALESGFTPLLHYLAWLGGRFTAVVVDDDDLRVVPDCHATQPVFLWSGSGLASMASHAALLAEAHRLPVNSAASELIELRRRINPRTTVHTPGLICPYLGIRPLFANCYAEISRSGAIAHRRFYPFGEVARGWSFDRAYRQFEELFVQHIKLLSSFGIVGVSLTAGYDSQATFAASRRHVRSALFAYTFFGFNRGRDEEIRDLLAANEASFKAGVPHRIVRWDRDPTDDRFARMYRATFPAGGQAPQIARALYEGLPSGFVEFMSTAAESGSGFYKRRDEPIRGASDLSRIYLGKDYDGKEFIPVFDDYINWTDFREERFKGADPYDLFYWEHRMTRWAAVRYQEVDLGHRVLLPYNHRGIVEAMWKAPLEQRLNREFQKRLIQRFP